MRSSQTKNIEPIATFVPQCPLGHWIRVMPGLSEMQRLKVYLKGEVGLAARTLCVFFVLVLLPLILVLVVPLVVNFFDRKGQCARLKWALTQWGSDHMPVTVCMQIGNSVIEVDAGVCSCRRRRKRSSSNKLVKLSKKSQLRYRLRKAFAASCKSQKGRHSWHGIKRT